MMASGISQLDANHPGILQTKNEEIVPPVIVLKIIKNESSKLNRYLITVTNKLKTQCSFLKLSRRLRATSSA